MRVCQIYRKVFFSVYFHAIILLSGCAKIAPHHAVLADLDLKNMITMLNEESREQATLLQALTSTPEYCQFSKEILSNTKESPQKLCMLKEFEGGFFCAICIYKKNSITYATWIPIHQIGFKVDIRTTMVADEPAAAVWKLLEKLLWLKLPLYSCYRSLEETSPAPCFLSMSVQSDIKFHCATYTHHIENYSNLLNTLAKCVGLSLFAGKHVMLLTLNNTSEMADDY